MSLTVDTLFEFKEFFDINFEATLSSLRTGYSERNIQNIVNGFLITVQDRLYTLKPMQACKSCGHHPQYLTET